MDNTNTPQSGRQMVATFKTAADARTFRDLLRNDPAAWYAADATRNGKEVVWTSAIPEDAHTSPLEYELSMQETVGYYGSTQSFKAKLNGRRCPMSY